MEVRAFQKEADPESHRNRQNCKTVALKHSRNVRRGRFPPRHRTLPTMNRVFIIMHRLAPANVGLPVACHLLPLYPKRGIPGAAFSGSKKPLHLVMPLFLPCRTLPTEDVTFAANSDFTAHSPPRTITDRNYPPGQNDNLRA